MMVCLRYAFTVDDPKAIASRFGLTDVQEGLKPRYNIAPTQAVPAVFNDSPKALSFAKWGMPAHWSGARHPLFNARAESIDMKASFRKDFELRRCLMIADSFYEWKHPTKRPFRVFLKDGGMFAFAGIYAQEQEAVYSEDSDPPPMIRSCCMVTVAANALVSQIHNRMPAILERGQEEKWLEAGPDEAKSLLVPFNEQKMDMYEVSMKVNSAANDSKDVLERKTSKGTLLDY